MKNIRNHGVGVAITSVTLAAVMLTGCGDLDQDECDEQGMPVSQIMKPRPGGGGSKPSLTKPRQVNPPKNKAPGKTGKNKTPKIHLGDGDCD